MCVHHLTHLFFELIYFTPLILCKWTGCLRFSALSPRLPSSMDDDLFREQKLPSGLITAIKFDVLTETDLVSIFMILYLHQGSNYSLVYQFIITIAMEL